MENLVVNPTFWKNKKVLVTGHTGFKGSWLTLLLQKLQVNLIGISKKIPREQSLFELAKMGDEMISINGDICDFDIIKKTIEEHNPEIIIHLAAQPLVQESYKNPIETFSTNIMGTVNLLEAVRKVGGVRAIINVTSDKSYENKGWWWGYRETD